MGGHDFCECGRSHGQGCHRAQDCRKIMVLAIGARSASERCKTHGTAGGGALEIKKSTSGGAQTAECSTHLRGAKGVGRSTHFWRGKGEGGGRGRARSTRDAPRVSPAARGMRCSKHFTLGVQKHWHLPRRARDAKSVPRCRHFTFARGVQGRETLPAVREGHASGVRHCTHVS